MIRAQDLLDVSVVALLIYFLLSSLSRARSRAFLLVLGSFGALHLLARAAGLHLSSMLLGAGLWVIALVVVVAFQDDIKRSLHRITAWRWLGGRGSSTETHASEELVASVERMAEKRVGALIVVPGHETLEPHVVYRAEYGDSGLWVRPAAMFAETVEHQGRTVPRFERIGD